MSRDTTPASVRSMVGRIAAHERWKQEPDRAAATAAARDAFAERFVDEVDPDRKLDPEERRKRAASARKAYYARLSLRSAQARRARAAADRIIRDTEAELRAAGGDAA